MARKKVVFVIVEGDSDEAALGQILEEAHAKNRVYIQVMRGDITTATGNTSQNILAAVSDPVRSFAKQQGLSYRDFAEILHVTDTDGAFADDSLIVPGNNKGTLYSATGITTDNPDGLIRRNAQKRGNIGKLLATSEIWHIPYRIFYMSCNLDHVLYNKQNSDARQKKNDSIDFANGLGGNFADFYRFLMAFPLFPGGDYLSTWEFIKQSPHSLERHSNFGLALPVRK